MGTSGAEQLLLQINRYFGIPCDAIYLEAFSGILLSEVWGIWYIFQYLGGHKKKDIKLKPKGKKFYIPDFKVKGSHLQDETYKKIDLKKNYLREF